MKETNLSRVSRSAFQPTRWSVVATAANEQAITLASKALAELCEIYWYPLYSYVRRCGHQPTDAEDLTQQFFARFLERNTIAVAQRERGKFRSFILSSLNHFLNDEWDKRGAQKRGARKIVSLDALSAESRYGSEPHDLLSPAKLFDRQWALRLLEEVMRRLRDEHVKADKGELFEAFLFCLTGDRSTLPYRELASKLNMTEGAVKVAVHRLRQRYRDLLRDEIRQTVTTEEEVEDELRYLFRTLSL